MPSHGTQSPSQPAQRPRLALTSRLASWKGRLRELMVLGRVLWRMTVSRPDLRSYFWSTFIDCARHNPAALESVVTIMVVYLHLGTFAQFVIQELDRKIEAEQSGSQETIRIGELQIA